MKSGSDIKRLSRLVAILTQLQTQRLTTAAELSEKFGVSNRTIYRDIRALEASGVPVITEEGKGYSLREGYRLPPVMFSEREANALITAEQLIQKNKDRSFTETYSEAIAKVKAVLRTSVKDKANLLSQRVQFRNNLHNETSSAYLSELQMALTGYRLTQLNYQSLEQGQKTQRTVEPFALYSTQENWILIAWCRLRNDFRSFRLDCIQDLQVSEQTFSPHTLTLQQYFEQCREKFLSRPENP